MTPKNDTLKFLQWLREQGIGLCYIDNTKKPNLSDPRLESMAKAYYDHFNVHGTKPPHVR